MILRLLLSLSLLLLAGQTVGAQSADDFFYNGAQYYLSNNIAGAREAVGAGLKLYPTDLKLKKLDELLKQQSQSSQQQNQQSQSQPNQSQNQKPDQQKPKDQPPDQQHQAGQQDRPQPEQQPPAPSSPQPADHPPGQENQNGSSEPLTAHAMTPQEAKRLLDAQKGNEQALVLKPPEKPENQNRPPLKDW